MSTKIAQNSIALKKMTYVLKSQQQQCLSFTLNPNQSLLYIQGNENLFILQLFCKMGQIKKHRQLFNKIGCCSALLLFMKKSNQFVTAAFGKLIFLWEFDFSLGWKINKFFQGHERIVTCLILNITEDQLISGSLDSTLRFWNKADNWQCQQTIVVDKMQILSICLNQTETKLIAYGSLKELLFQNFQNLKKFGVQFRKQKLKKEINYAFSMKRHLFSYLIKAIQQQPINMMNKFYCLNHIRLYKQPKVQDLMLKSQLNILKTKIYC